MIIKETYESVCFPDPTEEMSNMPGWSLPKVVFGSGVDEATVFWWRSASYLFNLHKISDKTYLKAWKI